MSENKITIVYFGTHEFGAHILERLASDERFAVVLVVTQPDRPVGRHQTLESPPVKIMAEKLQIPVIQPADLKNLELSAKPMLTIVAQYGRLIPPKILTHATRGTINVHTSLLPKYRGASPIQSALLNGEHVTGVTIMLMEAGLDTGPILTQTPVEITPTDTYETLDKKLALVGSEILIETIPKYLSGEISPQPQAETEATLCRKLDRDTGRINWHESADTIYNQLRALTPWPGVWTTWDGKRLKLLKFTHTAGQISPGQVQVAHDALRIGCGDGAIEVTELQLEGRPAVTAAEFVRGYPKFSGSQLI